jgi:putative ABC transport system ATP-binding protein
VVIDLRGITRTFDGTPPVHALRGIDLTMSSSESLAVVGPSGSGKSTLLNVLGCLDKPTTGSYELLGINVGELNDRAQASVRAELLGFVFQSFHLLSHRTVLENVMMAELYQAVGVPTIDGPTKTGSREQRALAALQRVGLEHRVGFKPTKLSGGERQRVAIARAIVHQPRVLLADEPTGNLDSANTVSILALFDELRADGLAIIVITHDHEVAAHFDRRVTMRDGMLYAEDGTRLGSGDPAETTSAQTF